MRAEKVDLEIRSEELARQAFWVGLISIVIAGLSLLLRQQNATVFAPLAALWALALSIRAVSYCMECPRPRPIAPFVALAGTILLNVGYVCFIWWLGWALGHMN